MPLFEEDLFFEFLSIYSQFSGCPQIEPRLKETGFLHMRNKDADQLRSNLEADQCLCFRNIASTFPLLPKYKISSL